MKRTCAFCLIPCWRIGGAAALCWTQQDVFRFDVRVDDFAASVKVVEALQDLESMTKITKTNK